MVYIQSETLGHCVGHFRHYVASHPFNIITGHKLLVGLGKLPLDQDPTGQRARWSVELDLCDWCIIHRDGNKHLNADAMSRRPPHESAESFSPSQPTPSRSLRLPRQLILVSIEAQSRAT